MDGRGERSLHSLLRHVGAWFRRLLHWPSLDMTLCGKHPSPDKFRPSQRSGASWGGGRTGSPDLLLRLVRQDTRHESLAGLVVWRTGRFEWVKVVGIWWECMEVKVTNLTYVSHSHSRSFQYWLRWCYVWWAFQESKDIQLSILS